MEIELKTPLSHIIRCNPFRVTFPENEVKATILDEQRIIKSIDVVKEELSCKLTRSECSNFLINQLAIHRIGGYEKYAEEFHQYHYQTLIETLQSHENGVNVNERTLKGSKLKHFKHIHHNSNTFIVKNLENYWRSRCIGQNEIQYQNKILNEKYRELINKYSKEVARKKVLSVVIMELMNECHKRNISEKTGEWIIFTKINGRNLYLCLATHNETKLYSDEIILKRIRKCVNGFPELGRLF